MRSESYRPGLRRWLSAALAATLAGTVFAAPVPVRTARFTLSIVTAVAQEKGWFREEFEPLGAHAELVTAPWYALPALFDRGDVHVGGERNYSLLLQILGGFDPVVIWQSQDLDPRAVVIVVRADSPIRSLAELKGRSFASSRYTCPYFSAYESLRAAGLLLETREGNGDVRYINHSSANGQSLALLLAGKVDALAVFPTIAGIKDGLVREIATALPGGAAILDRSVQLAPRKWVNENPDLVRAYIRVYNRSRAWIVAHPDEAAHIAAPVLRQPEDLLRFQFKDRGNSIFIPQETDCTAAIGSMLRLQQKAADLDDDILVRRKLDEKTLAAAFDRRFFHGGSYEAIDDNVDPKQGASAP